MNYLAANEAGSYEERECYACLRGLVYDGRRGAWVECGTCSGTARALVYVYPKPKRRQSERQCGR